MDAFGNNDEDPVDPNDWGQVDAFGNTSELPVDPVDPNDWGPVDAFGNNSELPVDPVDPSDCELPVDPVDPNDWGQVDAFGNNSELPVDPVDPSDWGEVDALGNNGELPVDPVDLIDWEFHEDDPPWLQDYFHNNNPAAAVPEGDIVQGDHQGDHREPSANISEMQTQSESVPFKIKVVFQVGQTNKRSRNFFVEPNDNVSLAKKLLVSKGAEVPKRYCFSTNGVILNEDRSFQDQGIRGVGVPKLEVLDTGSNFPCVCPEATSSEQGGRATAEVLLCDQCGGRKSR